MNNVLDTLTAEQKQALLEQLVAEQSEPTFDQNIQQEREKVYQGYLEDAETISNPLIELFCIGDDDDQQVQGMFNPLLIAKMVKSWTIILRDEYFYKRGLLEFYEIKLREAQDGEKGSGTINSSFSSMPAENVQFIESYQDQYNRAKVLVEHSQMLHIATCQWWKSIEDECRRQDLQNERGPDSKGLMDYLQGIAYPPVDTQGKRWFKHLALDISEAAYQNYVERKEKRRADQYANQRQTQRTAASTSVDVALVTRTTPRRAK